MTENFNMAYLIKKKIGEGGFGSVYIGERISDSWKVAIKIIPNNTNSELLKAEIENLRKCNSKFIVRYLDAYNDDNKTYLVMEYCHCKSLSSYNTYNLAFSEVELSHICACVLFGLKYIHSKMIMHRDIKPENLFLSEDGVIKIGDLGLSSQLDAPFAHQSIICGTYSYMAPEVFDGKASMKSDIWSLGISLIELAEGSNPFENQTTPSIIKTLTFGSVPVLTSSAWSPEFNDFIQQCLTKDAQLRPTHPFVKDAIEVISRTGTSIVIQNLVKRIFETAGVSKKLAKDKNEIVLNINKDEEFYDIIDHVHTIHVASDVCNSEDILNWNLSNYPELEYLIIDNSCFMYLKEFILTNMGIKEIRIGTNSCKHCNLFKITNCNQLNQLLINNGSFTECNQITIEDCIQLQRIDLGKDVFAGLETVKNNVTLKSIILVNPYDRIDLIALKQFVGKMRVFRNMTSLRVMSNNDNNTILELDIPNLELLRLPASFIDIEIFSITNSPKFNKMHGLTTAINNNNNLIINNDALIENLIEWNEAVITVEKITVAANSCNEERITQLDFSKFITLKVIDICNNCFKYVNNVQFNNVPLLEQINIQNNCFTKCWDTMSSSSIIRRDAHFSCINNPKLISLTIGRYSCNDFNECTFNNLPSLQTLVLGILPHRSWNFYYANFKLLNLPELQVLHVGYLCFRLTTTTLLENLPKLKEIQLGKWAFQGKLDGQPCNLIMRNLPSLVNMLTYGCCFSSQLNIQLEHIPNVTNVQFLNLEFISFSHVTSSRIDDVAPCLVEAVTNHT